MQLVRVDAGQVDEVAACCKTSFKLQQRGAGHGIPLARDGEDPGGCDQQFVAGQVPGAKRKRLASVQLLLLYIDGHLSQRSVAATDGLVVVQGRRDGMVFAERPPA